MEYYNYNLRPHDSTTLRDIDTEEQLIGKLRENHHFMVGFFSYASEDESWTEQHPKLLQRVSLLALEKAKEGSLALVHARRITQYVLSAKFKEDQNLNALSLLLEKAHLSSRNDHRSGSAPKLEISRFLLNACGSFFRKALNSTFKEASGHIALDISQTQLSKFKELIESGSLPDLEQLSNEEKNQFISNCLLIGENIPEIIQWISRQLNENNVLFTLHQAYTFNLTDLIQNCFKYFNSNFESMQFNFLHLKEVQIELRENLTQDDFEALQPIFNYFQRAEKDFCLIINHPNYSAIELAQKCRVTAIRLSGSKIDDQLLIKLAQECPNLSTFKLAFGKNITDDAIIRLAEKCPNLSCLDLTGSENITDKAIIHLGENCAKLSSMSLAFCKKFTDESIIHLAGRCLNLSDINLFGCENFTDNGIIQLSENCPKLSWINLYACGKISDAIIVKLKEKHPNLKLIR